MADEPADEFRALMAGFPTGVAVVTTVDGHGRPVGMTCSSVCSVTLHPPTLLVCLRTGSRTLDAVLAAGAFAVNLLDHDARGTAQLFASGARDRFDSVHWTCAEGAAGPHLPLDAHSTADCRVSRAEEVGDHTIVFGQVTGVRYRQNRRPLLYGLRHYAHWPEPVTTSASTT